MPEAPPEALPVQPGSQGPPVQPGPQVLSGRACDVRYVHIYLLINICVIACACIFDVCIHIYIYTPLGAGVPRGGEGVGWGGVGCNNVHVTCVKGWGGVRWGVKTFM